MTDYLEDLEPKAQNARRAGWAEDAVNVFGVATYCGRTFTTTVREEPADAYTMVQDLISDLLHLAVQHNWDADELLDRAKNNFDYENDPNYQGD